MSWKQWNGDKVIRDFEQACTESLENAAEATGSVSDQLVPHDEGTLQGTKTIKLDPNDIRVWIGYGGGGVSGKPKLPYARWWHENPANFQKGRTHNYLRSPWMSNFPQNLKRAVQQFGLKFL